MSNKSNGTAFEKEVANLLSAGGFWVHRLQDNRNGQPFDIMAVRDNVPVAIECKVCEKGVFDFSRIEENQIMAFEMFHKANNSYAFFAFKDIYGDVTFMPFGEIRRIMETEGKSGFKVNEGYNFKEFEYLTIGGQYECIHKQ
jgi:Holliday junction resolvase